MGKEFIARFIASRKSAALTERRYFNFFTVIKTTANRWIATITFEFRFVLIKPLQTEKQEKTNENDQVTTMHLVANGPGNGKLDFGYR
jgi:hypothetical protein